MNLTGWQAHSVRGCIATLERPTLFTASTLESAAWTHVRSSEPKPNKPPPLSAARAARHRRRQKKPKERLGGLTRWSRFRALPENQSRRQLIWPRPAGAGTLRSPIRQLHSPRLEIGRDLTGPDSNSIYGLCERIMRCCCGASGRSNDEASGTQTEGCGPWLGFWQVGSWT